MRKPSTIGRRSAFVTWTPTLSDTRLTPEPTTIAQATSATA
jgi:hypothetical protein